MNSFDSMIERYKKELVDAKRRSIEREILSPSFSESEPVSEVLEEASVPTFAAAEEEDENPSEENFSSSDEEFEAEPLGLSDPLENAAKTAAEERNFPDEREATDSESEAFEDDGTYPESFGSLKVQVFMANRAYPVSSANVIITGRENKKVYFDGFTNTNGVVGSLLLPAPKKSFSQSPQEKPPFAQYDITVSHPNFQKRKYLGVPVFSGVESIQNIQLLPLGTDESENTDVTESEPNELLMKGGNNNA